MDNEIVTDYDLPMKTIETITDHYHEQIVIGVDKDYKILIYITNIDRVRDKTKLSNLTGRGYTYREACVNFIENLMDKDYNIRYKSKFYATETIRDIVRNL